MATVDRIAPAGVLTRLGVVVAAGLALGVATSYLQGVLPGPTNFLADSGAVWSVLAFALAWWAVRVDSLPIGVGAGVAGLVGEVLGYYAIASPLRDIATTPAERTLWITAGFVFGVAVGVAAFVVRHATTPRPSIAAGAVSGLLVGEGVHAAVALGYPTQASIELGAGGVAVIASALLIDRSWRGITAAVGAALLVAALVALAYSVV